MLRRLGGDRHTGVEEWVEGDEDPPVRGDGPEEGGDSGHGKGVIDVLNENDERGRVLRT